MRQAWIAASAIVLAVGMTNAASAVTLKAAHYLSPKHPVGVGYETFAAELKKNTKGEVTVRIFPGESLLGAKAISDGIRDKVADVGFDTLTYTPSYYPHGILLNDLAMVGENDMAAAMAITELFMVHCTPCRMEFEKQNQIFGGGMSTAPYVLVAKGDLNSAEKIKGKKLRAGGSLWDRFANSVGATGVNVPSSEMYESLSRGIIDAAIYAVGGLKTHGLADAANQVVMLNLGSFRAGNLYSFNRDTWSKLTTEQRAAAFKAIPVAIVRTVNEYHLGDKAALELAKEKKIPIVQPDASLTKARKDFVEKDLNGIIENAKTKLKIDGAKEFVDKYRELLAKYEKLIAPIEADAAKLSDMFYNEVYAKLDPAKYGVK
jgi:TRAP-type C4-dicarboxylate transport system substrate-binding protein